MRVRHRNYWSIVCTALFIFVSLAINAHAESVTRLSGVPDLHRLKENVEARVTCHIEPPFTLGGSACSQCVSMGPPMELVRDRILGAIPQ